MNDLEVIQSEKSVVGIMLMEPDESARVFDTLIAKMFYSQDLGLVFDCCKKLRAKGMRADAVTVVDKLGKEYAQIITECAETVPSISGLDSYINSVLDAWRERTIRSKLNEMCESGEDADSMTAELRTVLEQQERIVQHQTDTSKTWKENIMEFMKWSREKDNSIKTGWRVLDTATGGLMRGGITVIAARPGCGKTTMGLQMASNIARDHKVLYVSLEMKAVHLVKNIISRFSGVNSQTISSKNLTEEEQQKVGEAVAFLYDKMQLHIDDTPRLSVQDIEAEIKKIRPDVVVIDHTLLLAPIKNRKNKYDENADNTHLLKELAKKYNINIIELVQASRESEGKVPGMADLYGGSATEQDADMIIGLCPEPGFTSKALCMMTVEVTKNRNGGGGSFQFAWDRPHSGIYLAEERED